MSIFKDIFDAEPDFVNEVGTKFWLDKTLSKYAQDKELTDILVYAIEDSSGYRPRLVLEKAKPIFENQSLESIGAYIDVLKLNKDFG